MARSREAEPARADRVAPGIWRLRLPLPWPGVPHVNAYAVAAGDEVVLFDTGMATDDGLRQLRLALGEAGFELADVRLLVCTHAHTDHYGLAGPVVDEAGCELWMHPAWEHVRGLAEDPERTLERHIEVARHSGVPAAALERYREARRGADTGIVRIVAPDRALVPGVRVESELGAWDVQETPGHAPTHICLHQRERGLLISGDHLLGRVSLFFDYGHTPDPVAEFRAGLDTVKALETGLCLAGHGRPFRDVPGKVAANRRQLDEHLAAVAHSLEGGSRTAFDVATALIGPESMNAATAAWGLQLALSYLDHLVVRGEATMGEDGETRRWAPR
jgi:glyoxylase-like metal-dependent hydrolase (beta-lactamase superfamily II)